MVCKQQGTLDYIAYVLDPTNTDSTPEQKRDCIDALIEHVAWLTSKIEEKEKTKESITYWEPDFDEY